MNNMKKYSIKIVLMLICFISMGSCGDSPIDEDGLLITVRNDCYVSNFELLDTDLQTVRVGNSYIDTLQQVVIAYVRFGTPINNLWPQFSLCTDGKLTPKITGRVDFTPSKMDVAFTDGDWVAGYGSEQLSTRIIADKSAFPKNALKYTVISGNRKVEKEYTVLVVERPMQ